MRNHRGAAALPVVLAVLLVVAAVAGPLILHFGQKRHNHLDFDPETAFPASEKTVPGEVFAASLRALIEQELDGVTGWRPNDLPLWGPTLGADNNANRQLGILQALRESVRVFKDHLTKVSSDEFDRNLQIADTALRNDAYKLLLPSAESKFREAAAALGAYAEGLRTTPLRSRPITERNVELIRLVQTWSDMLGDAHARLYRTAESWWRTDDDFYFSQGVAHAIHHLVRAVEREYAEPFAGRTMLKKLFAEVQGPLGEAAGIKPLIIFDGRPDGLLANHRRNLDGYITEARQKMYSIREELEK